MRKGYQNLHVHTTASDGELNHIRVLDVCRKCGISVVAFTDHDSVPSQEALRALEKNKGHPTKWILGVEISSGWPKEIGGAASNFHIVGLFVDPKNRALERHCQKAKAARRERMERMVNNLRDLGFEITKQACLSESEGEAVGRPHIVAALKKKRKNRKLIRDFKKKMKKEAKSNSEIRKKWEKIEKRPDQAPYALFLSPNAFVKGVFVPYLYFKNMDQSVELIREAGGVALLAHWTFCKPKVPLSMVEKFFKQERLDGAEIVFGLDKENQEKLRKDMEAMEGLTKKHDMLQAGGGDSHTKEDLERFSRTDWVAEKTVGMVERMRKKKDLNLKFSSLLK